MTEHDHDHDHDAHEHHHAMSWQDALEELREAARHFYEHQFDWRGHGPPEGFDGPRWFPPDEAWRLGARLDRDAPGTGEHVELATSTGKLRDMENAGQLVFDVAGKEQRLTAFLPRAMDAEPVLFVPFRDTTSGVDTYGAGRYVEVPYDQDDDVLELDFNYAYNPSCAFSPAYDCPFPPAANRLNLSVTAGEKLPSGGRRTSRRRLVRLLPERSRGRPVIRRTSANDSVRYHASTATPGRRQASEVVSLRVRR